MTWAANHFLRLCCLQAENDQMQHVVGVPPRILHDQRSFGLCTDSVHLRLAMLRKLQFFDKEDIDTEEIGFRVRVYLFPFIFCAPSH